MFNVAVRCVGVCVLMKLHPTAQPGPDILIFLCYSNGSSLRGTSECVDGWCGHHFQRTDGYQPGLIVAKRCLWSAEQGNELFSFPRSRLRIWFRDLRSAIPFRLSPLIILHAQRLNLVLTFPPAFSRSVRQNRPAPSGQSRVYHVTQMHTDDVHHRESHVTCPVVKVSRLTGASFSGSSNPITNS